jgi:hypothetical protein
MSAAGSRASRARTTEQADPYPATRRIQVLVGAALGSILTSYLIMAVVAALAGASASAPPAPLGVLAAGLPLWLAAHQVPMTIAGAPLGVLPLLPTLGVAAVTANFAAAALAKLGGRWGGDAARVVATMGVAHASLAVLSTALPTEPVRAEPWPALLGAGLVAAAGAALGALRVAGAPDWWPLAPRWVRVGLAAAATGIVALLTAGALFLVAGLVVDLRAVHDGFGLRPGFGPGIGVTVVSICYLPNALVGAVSWLAGPGVIIGSAVASPLGVSVGPLPPLPLFAAVPTSAPPGWAAAVFVFPVIAGVLIGLRCRRTGVDPMARLRAVGVAAATVALAFALAAALVSGRLAAGPFDPVDLPALSGALALLGWLLVPASVAALVPAELLPGRSRRSVRVGDPLRSAQVTDPTDRYPRDRRAQYENTRDRDDRDDRDRDDRDRDDRDRDDRDRDEDAPEEWETGAEARDTQDRGDDEPEEHRDPEPVDTTDADEGRGQPGTGGPSGGRDA